MESRTPLSAIACFSRTGSEFGMPASIFPFFSRFSGIGDVPILDFRTDLGGEATGIKECGLRHPTLTLLSSPTRRFPGRAPLG